MTTSRSEPNGWWRQGVSDLAEKKGDDHMLDLKVLQPDEAQEARTTYARFVDCVVVLRDELRGRGFDVADAALVEVLLPTYFRPAPTLAYPPELTKAMVEGMNAVARSVRPEDDE